MQKPSGEHLAIVALAEMHLMLLTKLDDIERLCRSMNHPGVNVGAHALAARVIAIIEEAAHA